MQQNIIQPPKGKTFWHLLQPGWWTHNAGDTWGHCVTGNTPDTREQILHDSTCTRCPEHQPLETEGDRWLPGPGSTGYVFNMHSVSFAGGKAFCEKGDCATTTRTCSVPLSWTARHAKFMPCVFYHNKTNGKRRKGPFRRTLLWTQGTTFLLLPSYPRGRCSSLMNSYGANP